MSWIERIKNDIIITTGDGKVYTPLYSIGGKTVEYNIAEFNFPNIGGTLVKKSEHKGTTYSLNIIFQGEDNIDVSSAFELSARDKRPWKISHPIYDDLIVHPKSLSFDNSGLNITKISIDLIETITEDAPKSSVNPENKIKQDVITQQEISAESFTNDVVPEASDLNLISGNVSESYEESSGIISDESQLNEYFNLFTKANSLILEGSSKTSLMITAVQDVLIYPSIFKTGVMDRLNLLKDQMLNLSSSIENLITPNEKKIFENNAGTFITGMVNASVNSYDDFDDYGNVNQVFEVIDFILFYYNLYLELLDSLQTPNGGELDSYIPDFNSISSLTSIVNYAVSQLFNIALDAKQERTLLLSEDSNVINLTYRFYGLDLFDVNIDTFMKNNNIGISEMFQIEKGREIKYYV